MDNVPHIGLVDPLNDVSAYNHDVPLSWVPVIAHHSKGDGRDNALHPTMFESFLYSSLLRV